MYVVLVRFSTGKFELECKVYPEFPTIKTLKLQTFRFLKGNSLTYVAQILHEAAKTLKNSDVSISELPSIHKGTKLVLTIWRAE